MFEAMTSETKATESEPLADETARRILRRNLLFRNLRHDLIDRIASVATRRSYNKGAVIFAQGDEGDALFGVASGRVRISTMGPDGREVFLNIMEPGDAFGEIAVIDGLPRTAGAVALDAAVLVTIARQDFLAILRSEPDVAMHLLELFCQRLRWTSDLVEESSFLVGPARLAKRLLVLAALHGRPVGKHMELALSQSELAQFLGISRQFVNQNLQAWRSKGWISLGRSRIVIKDAEALGREADVTH
jgi:CRP-like cAMP-binding protein